jgi:hypothetical protein
VPPKRTIHDQPDQVDENAETRGRRLLCGGRPTNYTTAQSSSICETVVRAIIAISIYHYRPIDLRRDLRVFAGLALRNYFKLR